MIIPILSASSSKIRVHYTGDLASLRDLEGVKIADHARAPIRLGPQNGGVAASSASTRTRFHGTGEILAVADTGLDGGTDAASIATFAAASR